MARFLFAFTLLIAGDFAFAELYAGDTAAHAGQKSAAVNVAGAGFNDCAKKLIEHADRIGLPKGKIGPAETFDLIGLCMDGKPFPADLRINTQQAELEDGTINF
jgi:hypothetical protein